MKLTKLILNNFLSYSNQTLNLNNYDGITFLIGKVEDDTSKSNGSGKSALFDAISWILFGVSRTASDDELIKVGEKEMGGSLEFNQDNKHYMMSRTKRFGKSQTLSFTNITDNISYTGNTVKETQANVIKALGLDDELYENTVFSRQGCIDAFPRQKPAKRKEMLRDILKISEYEVWEKQAKEFARTYETQYESLKVLVDKLTSEIEIITVTDIDLSKKQIFIKQIQDKIKLIENDINEKVKVYNQVKTTKQLLDREYDNNGQFKDDMSRIQKQLQYIDDNAQKEIDKILLEKQNDLVLVRNEEKVKSILAEIDTKLKAEESAKLQYETLRQQDELLGNELVRILGMTKEYDKELDKLRNKLNTFKELKDKCPVCNSVLNDEQKKKVENEIISEGKEKKEYRGKLQEEYDKSKETYQKLKTEIKNIDTGFGKSRLLERDKERYEKELLDIQVTKNKIEYADTKIEETKSMFMKQKLELSFEMKRKEEDLKKSEKLIETYKFQVVNVEKIESEIKGMDEIKKTYIAEEKTMAEELHRLQYELETKKKKQEELVMNKIKVDKTKMDFFIYSELVRAFGKNGIPLLVIENALAELQSEVMNQLNTLSDGTISVEFRTQRELKDGGTSDTLDIIVSDRSGARDFNLYSGGEKMRIALAIRLGLSRLLSRRAGKRFDILIIDEISDLDINGLNKFIELLNLVAKDYTQIFIVSHINELKDRFGQVIQVIKDKEGSRIV